MILKDSQLVPHSTGVPQLPQQTWQAFGTSEPQMGHCMNESIDNIKKTNDIKRWLLFMSQSNAVEPGQETIEYVMIY